MRTTDALGLTLALLVSATACVSTSTQADVDRVRHLARPAVLPRFEGDVEEVPPEELERLLAEPLDAERAVRVALLANRELRAQLRALGVPRGRLLQAGVLPNPVAEVELLPERNSSLELRLEYDLSGAVLAPLRRRALEPELEVARYEAARAVVLLGYRVQSQFFAVQAAQQRWALAQQTLDAQLARRDAAVALEQAGNLQALDRAREEVAYQRARVAAARLELENAEQREALQRLLGLHGEQTAWTLREPLAEVDAAPVSEELERKALSASLELRALRARLEGLARQAGFRRTEGWLPDVAADVHVLRSDEREPPGEDSADWRVGGGVSVALPVFDRGQGDVLALEAQFDAALERYYGMAVDLRSRARELRAQVTSAELRARQLSEVIVPAQRAVTEQTLLQYNAMQLGVFELLQARRDELSVRLEQVDTLREYWQARAALAALLAGVSVSAPPGARAEAATVDAAQETH